MKREVVNFAILFCIFGTYQKGVCIFFFACADAPLVMRTSRMRMNSRRCERVHAPPAMCACACAAGDARERVDRR